MNCPSSYPTDEGQHARLIAAHLPSGLCASDPFTGIRDRCLFNKRQPNGPQQKHKQCDGAGGKDHIGNEPCPAERAHDRTGGNFRASREPQSVFDGIVELIKTGGDQAENRHACQAPV